MKRNKKKAKDMRSGVSPYVRHEKAPYKYSPQYYAWKYEMVARVNKAKANTFQHMV